MMSVTKDCVADKCLDEIRRNCESLCNLVTEAAKAGHSLRVAEESVLRCVLEMGRSAINALIALQGDGDLGESVTTGDGETLKRSELPQNRRLRTIFGEHSFEQFVYSRGAKRKIDLRPIDARLSLSPRITSYLLEEFSQLFCIESAFGQAAENLETVLGQKLSVDTLESISRQVGPAAETFSDSLPTPPPAEEGQLMVGTVDEKGVPLIQDEPAKVKAFETRKLRPGNRRMATVAGLYTVDPYVRTPQQIVAALFREDIPLERVPRPKPQFKRLTVHFPETYGDGDEIFESTGALEASCWMTNEIAARRKPTQPLLLLIDGDHRLWETAASHLPDDAVGILDIVHVSSYVWDAGAVLCGSQAERERFTYDRLLTILEGGVKSVIRGLRHMATARNLRGEQLKKISTAANYFEAHAERMRYDEYLRAGYPIATGVIEGACRHLVKDRMERSGMRWTISGAKSMLNVRAVHQSGCWKEFHATHQRQECERFHPHRQLLRSYKPFTVAC